MSKKNCSREHGSFYGKKHSDESKKKMGAAQLDYSGNKNPFYGKTHSQESIDKIKNKLKNISSGENNPFYGKSHSEDSLRKIKEGNKKYREENAANILEKQLLRLGLTKKILEDIFFEYKNSEMNLTDIQEKLSVDKRVILKYIKFFEIATEKELSNITYSKKMRRSKSSPELKIYNFLSKRYGEENVIWSHKINNFFYDFFVFKSILIEYDGYYWHTFFKTNDDKKNNLAKELSIPLIRISEPESRKTNFEEEFKRISEVIDEIQASRNKIEKNIELQGAST